ncbi:metalloregulator ArsR/SmtB family transcription factor [Cereibacter sphaeroides]|uniref:ArsR/SmtB family transcription factor n=1 Tax=Rhodobacterales TaxID=204455 RepID=UPI000BBEED56|nr:MULTISPECIES: metalloregulator ArsR/SmtB family transcription factor [Paracoccaceae]MCE6960799.1 metalloregulator ArsR/SmtB family transcription factor [Cereibacter sphaeroides]MCE6969935.1 metalloregulator ArsR/SmtB family transcription factor [Cereibacter sphaeroides]MCE6974323.1 metalloregulator ArsR/SmtB family transcription factor [Cereibacter sphaeroides]
MARQQAERRAAEEAAGADRPGAAALIDEADAATGFLKALGHEGRLTILCHLISGPKSVMELETLLSSRQAAVSQQLARLRLEGLVTARREGQAIFYSILDPKVERVVGLLAELFCRQDGGAQ